MNKKIFMLVMIAAMVLLLTSSAVAQERTDASGQWVYDLQDGGAIITGYAKEI